MNLSNDGSFSVKKDDMIFVEAQNVSSISILAKGRIDVYISSEQHASNPILQQENEILPKSYRLFSLDKNLFIGVNDLALRKKHSFSYLASADSVLYAYVINDISHIKELFASKNDYAAYVINSIYSIIELSYASLLKLEEFVNEQKSLIDNLSSFFWVLKEKHGFSYEPALCTL
ncbi:MAG: hypothetical protein ACOZCL_06265 [Bacillota bacterium]